MKKLTALILCIVLTVAALTVLSVAASAEEAGASAAASDVGLKGYQNETDGFGIRLVAQIANPDTYREVGFILSNGAVEKKVSATYMFKTLTASDGETTYDALEADADCYLFALVIGGIAQDDALTLRVKPYAVAAADGQEVVGEEKSLAKAAGEQFKQQEDVHIHAPVAHVEVAASYATGGKAYWACEGCGKKFSDSTCQVEVDEAVAVPAQKDDETFVSGEETPYLIANKADYEAFAADVNAGVANAVAAYVRLTANIGSADDAITVAIGTNTGTHYFEGHFDGNGHEVYVNLSSTTAVGVIAYLRGGEVRGLTVRGSVTYTNATTTDNSAAGGVVGLITAAGGNVTDCHNWATITGTDGCNVGGIVGQNNGGAVISGCTNNGTVVGGKLGNTARGVGGIIGRIYQVETTIRDCVNNGAVSSTGSSATVGGTGGIVGISTKRDAAIISCTNHGKVSGYRFVGGILGRLTAAASLQGADNTGSISGTRDLGGIIGGTDSSEAFNLTVTGAVNSGDVTGTGDFIGGIIGYVNASGGVLTNCENSGNITGVKVVGGIVGLLNGNKTITVDGANVHDCTINGVQSVGGWIGRIVKGATATFAHYAAPTRVTYQLASVTTDAVAGFDTNERTDGATAQPGEAFGTCPGTAKQA